MNNSLYRAFDKHKRKIKRFVRSSPTVVARTAESGYKESFRLQRFNDDNTSRWRARKRRYDGRNPSDGVLIGKQGGTLNRDISAKRITPQKVTIETGFLSEDYAAVHNEGKGPFPKRKYIGKSIKINREIKSKLVKTWRKS